MLPSDRTAQISRRFHSWKPHERGRDSETRSQVWLESRWIPSPRGGGGRADQSCFALVHADTTRSRCFCCTAKRLLKTQEEDLDVVREQPDLGGFRGVVIPSMAVDGNVEADNICVAVSVE
jgi:hypothetical protein